MRSVYAMIYSICKIVRDDPSKLCNLPEFSIKKSERAMDISFWAGREIYPNCVCVYSTVCIASIQTGVGPHSIRTPPSKSKLLALETYAVYSSSMRLQMDKNVYTAAWLTSRFSHEYTMYSLSGVSAPKPLL